MCVCVCVCACACVCVCVFVLRKSTVRVAVTAVAGDNSRAGRSGAELCGQLPQERAAMAGRVRQGLQSGTESGVTCP